MPRHPAGPVLTRRTVLLVSLGSAGLAGLTGCGPAGGPGSPAPAAPGSPSPTPTPATAPGPDPDVALVVHALAAERRALQLAEATAARFPALAGRLRSARSAHRAHVALLEDAVPGAGSSPAPAEGSVRVPSARARALPAVAAHEVALSRRHEGWALAAASGPFARVLAGMAAAAAQQAAVVGGQP